MPPKDPTQWNTLEFRSSDTFGISGQLGADAEVYCTTLFSTRHLGRVSDLLAARLENLGANEFHLRCSILVSIFEACKSLGSSRKFSSPLVLECGLDTERAAIGVNFAMEDGMVVDGKPHGLFGAVLADIQKNSDLTILKLDPNEKRVEIVALLGFGSVQPLIPTTRPPVRILLIAPGTSKESRKPAPKPAKYLDLGDLDYDALLASDSPVKLSKKTPMLIPAEETPAPEERTVKGRRKDAEESTTVEGGDEDPEETTRVRGGLDEDEGAQRIRGSKAEKEGVKVVKGKKEKPLGSTNVKGDQEIDEDGEIRIEGDDAESLEVLRVKGGKSKKEEEGEGKGGFFRKMRSRFRNLIGQSEEAERAEEAPEENVLDYGKSQESKAAKSAQSSATKAAQTDPDLMEPTPFPTEPVEIPGAPKADGTMDAAAIEKELASGAFDQLVISAEREMSQLKAEAKNPKVSAWMDSLMTKLIKEKARLSELTRKVNLSVRLKEMEFKEKYGVMREEVRKRDLMVAQKNAALIRTKEQLAKINDSYEKLKLTKTSKSSTSDETFQRQKLMASQNLVTTLKEENALLVKKIEDLKKSTGVGAVKGGPSTPSKSITSDETFQRQKLTASQNLVTTLKEENALLVRKIEELKKSTGAGAVKVGASANQYADLHGRYERLFKQSEELKKNNQQLMEKLMDPKRSSSLGGSDDARRKLETSMQLLATEKKEKEALKARVLATQQDQVKLRDEIRRLTLENKRLAQVGSAPAHQAHPVPSQAAAAAAAAVKKKPEGGTPPASGKAA